MTTNPKRGRWRGAFALVAASAIGVVGFAMPASAVTIAPHNIDPNAKGSVILTKYATPEADRPSKQGNGKPIVVDPPTPGSTLLDGAEFTAYRVNIGALDLTKDSGWQYLETFIGKNTPGGLGPNPSHFDLNAKVVAAGGTLTSLGAKTTGVDGPGVAKWDPLEIGLYYFQETVVPAGHKASAPFFVTVPMTDPDALDKWMYNIYVYPKNIEDDTEKVPQDKDVHVAGDVLNWDIHTKIPGNGGTETVTTMQFEDALSTALTYNHPDVRMQINDVWDDAATPPASELIPDVDFETSYVGHKVTAKLLPLGLAKLNANFGENLIVRIKTTVADGFKGTIDNEAVYIVNKPGSTDLETSTTRPGLIKFAEVTVNKVDMADVPLPGAEFIVYYSHKAAPNFTVKNDPDLGIAPTGAQCKMTAPATSCKFSLRFSDFAENEELLPTDGRYNYYYLVESVAPSGYELLVDAIPFQITETNTTEDPVTKEYTLTNAMKVTNVLRGGGLELPFTGGAGTVLFIVIGVALLGGATTMTVIRSRRRRVDA